MTMSGFTMVAFPLITGVPSEVVLTFTRAPDNVLYEAPDISKGEYATKPSITCAFSKLFIWSGGKVVLDCRVVRKASLLGAKTVILGMESSELFERAR